MKTRVDEQLRAEASRYALRLRCETCAHFVEETAACANEYPNAAHRDQALDAIAELEFCKEFELG